MSVTALSIGEIRDRTQQRRQQRTYECAYCDDERDPEASVKGSYCSWECYDDHEREKAARDVLRTIEKDHRYCGTCYRKTKVVERPPNDYDYPDVLIGYEYPTPNAEEVWKDPRGRQGTGLGCTCGNCQHSHRDPDMQPVNLMIAVHRLLGVVATLRAERESFDHRLDREQLFQAAIDTGAIRPALEVSIEP